LPSARYTNRAELREFERSWRQAHSGQLDDTKRLVGFCLAVRRGAFESVGGFDEGYTQGGYEDDDLCRKLVAAGGRLVIAHGSYVHHVGHASFDFNGVDWREAELDGRSRYLASSKGSLHEAETAQARPRISACLIVKDEEDNLPRCLESLKGVADELVVGDTGSGDSSVQVAESFGAKVVRVPWEDHFAKARNAALEHCTGDWVLWLDADEEWVGDGEALHREVAGSSGLDGLLVTISNVEGNGTELRTSHPAVRVFRKGLCWAGRIHEQIVPPEGGHVFARPAQSGSIAHYGYLAQVVSSKNKLERNLRLALAGLEEARGAAEEARCHLDVGRSLYALRRYDEALEHLEGAANGPEPRLSRRAMHVAARTCFSKGDLEGAAAWAARLRRASANPLLADILAAEVAYRVGLYGEALKIMGCLQLPAYDEDYFLHQKSEVAGMLAACHRSFGRSKEALQALLEPLAVEGTCAEPLSVLIDDAKLAGEPLSRLGESLPLGSLKLYVSQLLHVAPDDALGVLEGAWQVRPEEKVVLAAAGVVAPKASPQAALPWAARLRQKGLACPMLAMARDAQRLLADRVLAAGAAAAAFGDPEARSLLEGLVRTVGSGEVEQVGEVLAVLAPDLLASLPARGASVGTAAPRPKRCQVSIVIPCWDMAHMTLRLLRSLQETLPEGGYELVIVDNGSSDATSRVSSNPEAGVVVVRNAKNLGFAVACNQGARAASADVLVFCNNDVVARPGWLPPLLAALDQPRVGVVGAKLLFPDGTLQHAGVGIFNDADGQGYTDGVHFLYHQPAGHPLANRARELRAVTGAVMAVPKHLFFELGGFDEGYWNGCEDVDFCLRAGEAGYRVWYEPSSVLVHQESASGPERFKKVTENRWRLTRRWAGKVLDEREDKGIAVVGPFGTGTDLDKLAQGLVSLADRAEVPVVTRSWPDGAPSWPHRLGPGQPTVLSVLQPSETEAYLTADTGWLPASVKVLAGEDELREAGLLGEGAVEALLSLTGGRGRFSRSSWRAERADCTVGPKEGL
jgi:GT2 family glycosyltransferase/tetratricopeptide (TPR) repeat protein